MTLRQRDITIEVREIPLPFLPLRERYPKDWAGRWLKSRFRHWLARCVRKRTTRTHIISVSQATAKKTILKTCSLVQTPGRNGAASSLPLRTPAAGLRRHFAYNCDYSRSFAAAGRAAAAGCATNDESRRWPGPRSQWPSRSGLTEPSHGLARESRYPDTAVDRSSYERAGQNSPRAKRRHSEDPCGGTLRGRNAGRRSTGRNGAPTE